MELRYIQLAKSKCSQCGCSFSVDNRLEIHHQNKNRDDNSSDNLIVLCQNCHHKEHYGVEICRNDDVLELRREELTYAAIGKLVGISRQRAHQICKTAYYISAIL